MNPIYYQRTDGLFHGVAIRKIRTPLKGEKLLCRQPARRRLFSVLSWFNGRPQI